MAARHKRKGGMAPNHDAKPAMAGGNPNVMEDVAKRKHGGKVLGQMAGAKAKHRLDRPGRKMGGRVGADKSPLSSAHSCRD